MGTLAPRGSGAMVKTALGVALEGALILGILGLILALGGVLLLRPAVQPELDKTRALDLLLAAPVPSVPGETCGSLVRNASLENGAKAHWDVTHWDGLKPYLVSVTIERGADSAVFHWTVDLATQRILSLETRSICNLP